MQQISRSRPIMIILSSRSATTMMRTRQMKKLRLKKSKVKRARKSSHRRNRQSKKEKVPEFALRLQLNLLL